jgi:cell wall-associated NlpC family hydrolase
LAQTNTNTDKYSLTSGFLGLTAGGPGTPIPSGPDPKLNPLPLTDAERNTVIETAKGWLTTPYGHPAIKEEPRHSAWGPNSKRLVGADCNGSVWGIYREAGISYDKFVTHQTIQTDAHWRKTSDPKAGDVVRWNGHLAIYDGNGKTYSTHGRDSAKGFDVIKVEQVRRGQSYEFYQFLR